MSQRFCKQYGRQSVNNISIYIVRTQNVGDLIEALPLADTDDFEKCVPFEKLTVEMAVYWLSLVEYLQQTPDDDDRIQDAICELSAFCNYVDA